MTKKKKRGAFTLELPDKDVRAWKRARQCRSNISTNVLGSGATTLGAAAPPLRKPMHPVTRAGAEMQRRTRTAKRS